jgi:hypothetical protein
VKRCTIHHRSNWVGSGQLSLGGRAPAKPRPARATVHPRTESEGDRRS